MFDIIGITTMLIYEIKKKKSRGGGTGLPHQVFKRLRQENQKFKASLGYRVSSRLAWATE